MQATMQRFVVSRTGITIFAFSILLNVALLIIALDQADALPSTDRAEQRTGTERPFAYYSAGMGEGLIDRAVPQATIMPKAYDAPSMGEGRLNLTAAIPTMVAAYTAPGQGEGWLAYGRDNHVPACGPGEGFLNPDLKGPWSCLAP